MKIENAGFFFWLNIKNNINDNSIIKTNSLLKHLPPEFGDDIVYLKDKKYYWAYFRPNTKIYSTQNIYLDNECSIVLFTGLIYSHHNEANIKKTLSAG